MRIVAVVIFSIVSLTLSAQNMNEIQKRVSQLFVATDNRDWTTVEEIFADQVELDYSSMNGNPATVLSPKQIIDAWKTVLPGFESTHHQVGNFIISEENNKAQVFCYGTATHYLPNPNGNVWTVVGSYNIELILIKGIWYVNKMKLNYKYQDGNVTLPQAAIDNVK